MRKTMISGSMMVESIYVMMVVFMVIMALIDMGLVLHDRAMAAMVGMRGVQGVYTDEELETAAKKTTLLKSDFHYEKKDNILYMEVTYSGNIQRKGIGLVKNLLSERIGQIDGSISEPKTDPITYLRVCRSLQAIGEEEEP